MNKFEPKSIRYRGELQKHFTDCSSFPKVDFTKFDFPIKIIEGPMDMHVEKEVFSAIRRVGVYVDKDELLRAIRHERDQYANGYFDGYNACLKADNAWEIFDLISSVWYGKGAYFQQDDGTVYSRVSGDYLSFDQAVDEFCKILSESMEVE